MRKPRLNIPVLVIYASLAGALATADGIIFAVQVQTPIGRTDTDTVVTIIMMALAVVFFAALSVLRPATPLHRVFWWMAWVMGAANIAGLIAQLLPSVSNLSFDVARRWGVVVGGIVLVGCGFGLYPRGGGERRDGV